MMRRTLLRYLRAPVTAYSLRDVAQQASPSDPIFASAKGNGFQYTCWPGEDAEDVANHLLQLPIAERGLHTVFGRAGVPVDVALDLDGVVPKMDRDGKPMNPTSLDNKVKFTNDLVNSVLDSIDRQAEQLFDVKVERRMVLESVKPIKISVHVHARFDAGAAFADHAHLKKFVEQVRDGMVIPGACPEYEGAARSCIDAHIFRSGGTLRLYSAVNKLRQSPMVLINTNGIAVRDGWQRGPNTAQDCMIQSWIVRPPLEVARELQMPGVGSDPTFVAAAPTAGQITKVHVPEDVDRQLDLLASVGGHMRPQLAEGYTDWSTVGLMMNRTALRLMHRGAASDRVTAAFRDSFHQFSRLCPHKYNEREVDRKIRVIRAPAEDAQDDPRLSLVWLLRRCVSYPAGLVNNPPPPPPTSPSQK